MKHLILALTLAATVVACTGGAEPASVPSDPDAVVLTVTSEGGFVPVEFNLDRMPRYVLTAGRTLYSQGPVPAIFPGPLLPNVQEVQMSEDAFDELLELVSEMGLPEIDERVDDSGAEMVADATTEFITYYDEEGPHRLGVHALGMVEGGQSNDRIFATEVVELLDESANGPGVAPHVPARLQVAAGPPAEMDEAMATVEEWPLTIAFAEMAPWGFGWRCTEVTGDAVADLVAVFAAANQATRWDTGTEELTIKVRPLLPGESACQGGPETS